MYDSRVNAILRDAGISPNQQPQCHACVDLDRQLLRLFNVRRGFGENAVRISAVNAGSSGGCQACAMLLKAVKAFLDDLQEPLLIQVHDGDTITLSDTLTLTVVPLNEDETLQYDSSRHIRLEIFSLPGSLPSKWDIIRLANIVARDASSPESVEFVQRHVNSCTTVSTGHSGCASSRSFPLPTRVLRVGDDHNHPYLYESQGESIKYIALSHCWGGVSPLITTKATLDQRKQAIPYFSLPKTFQDAVCITRKLGVEYLWIDSLCIIQDSPEDWARESARMGSLYSNSWITIAADAAEDSNTGFLRPQQRVTKVVEIPCESSDGAETYVYVREKGSYANRARADLIDPDTGYVLDNAEITHRRKQRHRSRLSTRAWVFQERLLAPRTVHYSLEETAYECRSGRWCECTISERVVPQLPGRRRNRLFKDMLRDKWNWIVLEYTRLNLTYGTDRLPALSGIASYHQERIAASGENDEYLAGLWRKDLAMGLLWRVYTDDDISSPTSSRLSKYCAPSWSWASVTGTVHWEDEYQISTSFVILDSVCTPDGPNRFGNVCNGYVKVQGYIAAVQLEADISVALPAGDDFRGETPINVTSVQTLTEPDLSTTVFYPDVCGAAVEVSPTVEYHFLLISEGIPDLGNELAPAGLILKRSPSDPSVFSRVGYACTVIEAEHFWRIQTSEDGLDDDIDEIRKVAAYRKSWKMWIDVASREILTIV
ncbi:HET-domain-containing protein [Rhizodiscina lignyota]|uniref:HET-domain-containing protein n=1 Tax=Rhizodiscina lignyota TaxID=1504668 RepID=A0A9P4IBM3_9PEZI|nr:HET-domain-containing protein [Rhizodiscina lignyota]